MAEKYIVRLTDGERETLYGVRSTLVATSEKSRRAFILLNADADGPNWTDAKIAEAISCRVQTVENVRKKLVTEGFEAALCRKKRDRPPREKILDGKQEAEIIAMRLGEPPEGFAKCVELIRDNGLPGGIGGHLIETIRACVDEGLSPDFWMKTLHHTNYWSAQSKTEHDNIFCRKPDDTIAYMESLPQPWIAFKILAAGAIRPLEGFRYAFQNGADFICVGMYDFQIVEDCNIATTVFQMAREDERKRPWRA